MGKTDLYRIVYHMRADGEVEHGNNPMLRDLWMDARRALAVRRQRPTVDQLWES